MPRHRPVSVGVSTMQGGSALPVPPTQTDAADTAAVVQTAADPVVGHVTVTATAPDLDTIAAWIDAVSAAQRFQSVWINGVSAGSGLDGTSVLQFTAEMDLNAQNLVKRSYSAPTVEVSP